MYILKLFVQLVEERLHILFVCIMKRKIRGNLSCGDQLYTVSTTCFLKREIQTVFLRKTLKSILQT